jgi:DNA polymerase III subunit beta
MKIICTQENLKTGLQTVSRIVGSSSTLPILNNVLLQTESGQLKISGTNLEIGISTFIRCKIEQEGGVCLSAKTILELVNNLPNENITIEVGESETSVSTDRYHTKIKQLPVEDFPLIPKVGDGLELSIPAAQLRGGLEQVVFAASTSETQPEISGILAQFNNSQLVLAATDRYRLAEKVIPFSSNQEKKVIIPQRSVLELSRLLANLDQNVTLQVSDTQLAVTIGETYVVTRLIDGQYPDYKQIVPIETGTVINVSRDQLSAALKTSGIFSRGVGSVTVAFDPEKQTVQINSISQEVGESVVDIPAEINGDIGSVIMNYRYVLDVLQGLTTETLTIQVINDSSPVVFRPVNSSDYLYLVMPIRL